MDFFSRFSEQIAAFFQKSFVKDSAWMVLAKISTSALQVIYFIVLARCLEPEGFGYFVGVTAIFSIVFPFVGLGMEDVLVQNVSRDESKFSIYFGTAILALALSVAVALVTIFPITLLLVPSAPAVFILLLFLADLVGLSLCKLAGNAFSAVHQLKKAAKYGMIYMICKIIAISILPFIPGEYRLLGWGGLYFLASTISAFILQFLVRREIGLPVFDLKFLNVSRLREGFFFSLSHSAVTINSQIDRTMLLTMVNPVVAGIYGAGVRFIDMGTLPILAVLGASYPRFFRYGGETGLRGTVGFARKLLPFAICYGIAAAVGLILFSPLVPWLLGVEFAESAKVLIWLAPINLLVGLQFLAADSLTGAGYQRSRSFIQVTSAVLNIGLNLYLIPIYSWQGAIWATLASETFRLVVFAIILQINYRKEARFASL
jgi:O-antigen/teichoic acid export membrane protein